MEYLKKWDKEYTRSGRRINSIKGALDMRKQKACLSKKEELVDKMYGDIRNTRLYKKVKAGLVEATKDWMKVRRGEFSINKIEACEVSVQKVYDEYLELVDKDSP
jgi:hypothetical protein